MLAATAIVLAGCSGSSPAQFTNATPQATARATPAGPSETTVVAVRVDETAGTNGFKTVELQFGLVSPQGQLWEVVSSLPFLKVAEGRTYQVGLEYGTVPASAMIQWLLIPPGLMVCGSDSGPFDAKFPNVPETTHPATATWEGLYAQTNLPDADLTTPLGSCQMPDLASMPTSVESSKTSSSDPGFSLKSNGPLNMASSSDNSLTPFGSVTITNHSQLDEIVFGHKGDMWIYTDKGYLVANGCSVDVGPGQTSSIGLCHGAQYSGEGTIGTPIAVLVVSPTKSWAVVKIG